MSDAEQNRAARILADARQALANVDLAPRVAMGIGTCNGTTPAIRIRLTTTTDDDMADRVAQALYVRDLLLAECGSPKPGTEIQQLARGEVLKVERPWSRT